MRYIEANVLVSLAIRAEFPTDDLSQMSKSVGENYTYMISFRFSRSRCSVAFLSRERQFNDDNEPWYCQQLLSITDIEHQPFSYDLNIVRTVIYSAIK